MKKSTLIYVYDGLCSWCYAIDKEVKAVQETFSDKLDVQLVSGGMFIGDQRPLILDAFTMSMIRQAYARVSTMGKVIISEKYLDGLIEKENYRLDSEKTAVAYSVYKSMVADRKSDLDFVENMQKNMYINGLNPNNELLYHKTAIDMGLGAEDFIQKMNDDSYLEEATRDFMFARELGVNSYPQIILKTPEEKYYLISKGYSDSATMSMRLNNIFSEIDESAPQSK